MKKHILTLAMVGIVTGMQAQDGGFVPSYIEDLYRYSDNNSLEGTARFRAMSGAMGALGGDLSATTVNPAGTAVFLNSEASITGGMLKSGTDLTLGNTSHSNNETVGQLSQAGGVIVFSGLDNANWRSVAMSLNYQRQSNVQEVLNLRTDALVSENGNISRNYYHANTGNSAVTNFNIAANYQDRIYIGAGLNMHSFITTTDNRYREHDAGWDEDITYRQDFTPFSKRGQGISLGLGVIGKLNQNVRLGASYKSPTWYIDTEETVTQYALYPGTDDTGEYYVVDYESQLYLHNMNSAQSFTGSAAFILGTQGLISADFTYRDYSTAKFKPENSFLGENDYMSAHMTSSTAIRVGGEMRIQDFRVRGGFRYETSPFDQMSVAVGNQNVNYRPFGDLTGFSAGVGYNFGNMFIDASYDHFSRDRNHLIYGDYYAYGEGIYTSDQIGAEQALDLLSFNMGERGLARSISQFTEKLGSINLTLGLRF
ncbi:MAG: hypothetical protein Q4F57_03335 [Weeksellaceae bacterium]|nr:hypothetical protein [Weeksellaceae bacterium]